MLIATTSSPTCTAASCACRAVICSCNLATCSMLRVVYSGGGGEAGEGDGD